MAHRFKMFLIACLAFAASVAVVDGRICRSCGDTSGTSAACGSTCGASPNASCPPKASRCCPPQSPDSADRHGLPECPAWVCLLCRCDDRIPAERDRIPSEPKSKAEVQAKPDLRPHWRLALQPEATTALPYEPLVTMQRLSRLCIWRL